MKIYLLSDCPLELAAPALLGPHPGTLVIHAERRLAEFSGASLSESAITLPGGEVRPPPLLAGPDLRRTFWRFALRYRQLLPLLGQVACGCSSCKKPRQLHLFGVDGVCFFCCPMPIVRCPSCSKNIPADRLVRVRDSVPIACAWCEEVALRPGIQVGQLNDVPIRRRGRPRKSA